jgi:polyhydroxyalkanoate synthesis regulator phasin
MVDKPVVADSKPAAPPATPPGVPRRGPGHRGQDVRDTVAEMAARAQEISLEAGSKMSAAMKDIIGAAAGLSDFVVESARDLLQYMVRRGQMTQDEADKLILEVEAAHKGRRKGKKGKTGGVKRASAKKRARPAAKKKAKGR